MADGAWIIRHGRSACMTASRDPALVALRRLARVQGARIARVLP